MSPPQPPKPRPGSHDLPKVEVDRTVGGAENQRRFDQPQRRQTFTGLGAVRPSGEFSPTLPAPAPRPTVRHQTPPAVLEAIRRGDGAEPAHAGAIEPAVGPQGVPSESPPASLRDDQEAILRKALADERAKVAELERQARVQAEARSPGPLELPVIPSERPAPITKAPESTAASEGSTKALRSALTKLVLGIAALLAILGIPLTAYIQALTTQIERSTSQAAQANAAAADAKAGNSKAEQEAAASKAELAAFKAYFREVMRLQGVEIAKQKDDPEAGDLKPVAPLCQTGKVCPGPQLIITVPP